MFDHLKEFAPDGTAWLPMPELGRKARLQLRPATEANRPYYNAMLKMAGKRVRTLIRGRVSPEDLAQNRDEDRRLYPKYVLVGWEHVETREDRERGWDEKEFVEFSAKGAAELCEKLPDHLFDRIRNFAATPEEFYPEDELPPDPEDLSGN
jgi:hypothetical protein